MTHSIQWHSLSIRRLVLPIGVLFFLLRSAGHFWGFHKRYPIVMTSSAESTFRHPGPFELIPKTKTNAAVYLIHRDLLPHCQYAVASLGCDLILNVSAREIPIRNPDVKMEHVKFDAASQPYDEALETFMKHVNKKQESRRRGNILVSSKKMLKLF